MQPGSLRIAQISGLASPPRAGLDAKPGVSRRAVFIDKDGTLVVDVPHNVDPRLLRFMPNALAGLQCLDRAGYALVIVTHQPGLAAGRVTRGEFARLQKTLVDRLCNEAGVGVAGFYTCPHAPALGPTPACLCRTPAPGLLRQAALAHRLDLARSWMVGDTLDDVEAGRRAGCRSVLVDVGSETEWRRSPLREPEQRAIDLLDAARRIVAADEAAQRAPATAAFQ